MDRSSYFRTIFGKREELLNDILRDSLVDSNLRPIQVDEEVAQTLHLLTAIHKPMSVIEIGSFVGYSAIHIGRALLQGGKLVSVEKERKLAEIAKNNIMKANLSEKVTIKNLDGLSYLNQQEDHSVDMIFIDADKVSYPDYLKVSARILKYGGLIIADDCYPDGRYDQEDLTDPNSHEKSVRAINSFNLALANSQGFYTSLIGSGNGLMVAIKVKQ